jgi:hypothetical protein
LTFQDAAVANQRQQVISDRERPVVAGGYKPQVHARLYHEFELRGLPSTRCGVICRRFEAFSGGAALLDGAAMRFAARREAAAAYC